jgi:multidrug efflux pump
MMDISELPIMYVNLSGDYDLTNTESDTPSKCRMRIESCPWRFRRVDIVGAFDREIQINVDLFKAAQRGGEPWSDIESGGRI